MSANDRTIHAEHNGQQIVRADRSGKWFLLTGVEGVVHQRLISMPEAVRIARRWQRQGGVIYTRPGGAMFTAKLRETTRK